MYYLLVLNSLSIVSQHSIKGTITNNENQSLIGVEIYAPELHRGTVSAEDGSYELNDIPNGTYKLIVTSLGYASVIKTVAVSGASVTLDIPMEESIFEIDEIIVSTPFNKLQSENVMKVEQLSIQSIKKLGSTSLTEGLTSIPGVSQISTGISIGKPVIRGLSGNRVLVYTQGIRLENQQFGGEHGLGLNDAGVHSIEVIKGPASLLYGSDAMGGVLNITPEKFATVNGVNSDVNTQYFSNTQGSNSSLGVKATNNNFKFLARGTYASHADYKTPTDERVTNTRFNEKDFKAGIAYAKNKFTTEIRYNFNDAKLGLTEGIENQSTNRTPLEPYQAITNHIISSHSHVFFGKSKLDIDLGYTLNNRKEFEHHEEEEHEEDEHDEDEATALDMALETMSYNLRFHFPSFNNIQIVSGVQGMYQTNTNSGEELLIPNATVQDMGIFTTANYDWGINALQLGVRFDSRGITTERHEVAHEDEVHIFNAIDKNFTSFTSFIRL